MKLIELIDNIHDIDDNSVIFMPKDEILNENANAVIITEEQLPDNGKPPEGLQYLLEVFYVKELLGVWRKWRNGKEPTREEKYQAFVYFIDHDAYIPTDL